MPNLDRITMDALSSYARQRDGHAVPVTNVGNIYTNACWCWALSGGVLHDADAHSYRSIQTSVITMSDNGLYPTAIQNAGLYPGCAAYFTTLQDMLDTYEITRSDRTHLNGFSVNELNFLDALVQIMARMNGLQIVGGATQNLLHVTTTYSLHVKSNNPWSVDHWALGIRPPGLTRMYVQTVPNSEVMHNCDTVWDEHRADAHFNLLTLLDEQVRALERVRPHRLQRRMSASGDLYSMR